MNRCRRGWALAAAVWVSSCGCALHEEPKALGPRREAQPYSPTDAMTARRIKAAIREDGGLSEAARHVQVVVQSGKVTLRGPVRSEEEKREVIDKAASVVGDPRNISDQLRLKY